MKVGIEAIHVYPGRAVIDVGELARARGLDSGRFEQLLLKRKTVSLNYEDPVSFAVNAARPLIEALGPEGRRTIELLIVCTESGIDFGKPMSTYIHHYLDLDRHCRTFELKHACYAATAGLQMAAAFVRSNGSPSSRALVISTDVARPIPGSYAEPSQGAAAVALLVSGSPVVLALEHGAYGTYGYEVMDSCRPNEDIETGDADLSLLSYLDCLENSFRQYCQRVGEVDFQSHFDYLAFHTPFGGLAKGAHRTMMRKLNRASPAVIEQDFCRRMEHSLTYCREVGNAYGATVFLALSGVIDKGTFMASKRIGLFSYGSGCCSEFYSGMADLGSQQALARARIESLMKERYQLNIDEYDRLLALNRQVKLGEMNANVDRKSFEHVYENSFAGRRLLILERIAGYHREYSWS